MTTEAVIFDLDGLLIDSEPHWRRAEIEVFARAGLTLTEAECAETTGLRIDEVVRLRRAQTPGWHTLTEGDAVAAILARVTELLVSEAKAMPGAVAAVRRVAASGVRVALASSSPMGVIRAGLTGIGLEGAFELVQSAESEPYGKPHPGVYLTTASRLSVDPTACVAVEDSLNGLIAAKAARMRCVAVPEHASARFAVADVVLDSLEALRETHWR
jgi:HAD superfamily hydrolase (TIGR01509 family)